MFIRHTVNYNSLIEKIVKLTRSINRRVGNEVYYKHIVTIPQKILDELKWNENTELKFEVKDKELRIKKK